MALLFCDSFDAYAAISDVSSKWTSSSGSLNFSATGGRFGGGSVNWSSLSAGNITSRNVGVSFSNTFNIGFYYKPAASAFPSTAPSATSNGVICLPNSATSAGCVVAMTTGGLLQVLRAGSTVTTALATGTHNICDGLWHWIEFQMTFSSSATGSFAIYVDGILDVSGSSVQTLAGGATANGSIAIGNGENTTTQSSPPSPSLDDVIVWDNTGTAFNTFPLGPRRIACLNPNAAGDSTQFTPSAGANYSCVSQAYSGTAYVTDAGSGNTDLYKTAGLAYTPTSTINAAVVNLYAFNPAGDGTRAITAKLKSVSTVAGSSSVTLPASAITLQGMFYKDASGAAWTAANINAAQLGCGD